MLPSQHLPTLFAVCVVSFVAPTPVGALEYEDAPRIRIPAEGMLRVLLMLVPLLPPGVAAVVEALIVALVRPFSL